MELYNFCNATGGTLTTTMNSTPVGSPLAVARSGCGVNAGQAVVSDVVDVAANGTSVLGLRIAAGDCAISTAAIRGLRLRRVVEPAPIVIVNP